MTVPGPQREPAQFDPGRLEAGQLDSGARQNHGQPDGDLHPGGEKPPKQRRLGRLLSDAVKFAGVGVVSYVVDLGIFNLLRVGTHGLTAEPLFAKSIAIAVATVIAWLGNRYWTFAPNRRNDSVREFIEFCLVAIAGWLLNLGVLGLTHYGLHLTSVLEDNIFGNVVGAFIGTVLRFVLYRWWVYAARSR